MSAGPVTLGAVLLIIGGYVAGSMPWGYWIVRVFRHDDIRKHGSGNTGATNVWRTFGPRSTSARARCRRCSAATGWTTTRSR